jgi:hypothetical protein
MRSSWSAPPTRSALLQRHPGQHRARADRQRRRGRRVAPRVSTGLRLSVLDQTPVSEGSTAAQALRNSIDLAQLADRLGYHRYWVAEHQGDGLVAGPSPAAAASGRAGARAWSCRDLQRRVPVRAIRDAGVRPGVGEQRPDDVTRGRDCDARFVPLPPPSASMSGRTSLLPPPSRTRIIGRAALGPRLLRRVSESEPSGRRRTD